MREEAAETTGQARERTTTDIVKAAYARRFRRCPGPRNLRHREVLRIIVPVPAGMEEANIKAWGYSVGYALLIGMERQYV